MKKNSLFIIMIIVFFFCFIPHVNAIYCSKSKFSDLKNLAFQTEVNYELKFDDQHNYYYQLKLSNVDNNIIVEFNNIYYEPENGKVKINERLSGGSTYKVYFLGGYDTSCVEELLYSKTLEIPKYNVFSERDECLEYEEFYMCNKWYEGNIMNDQVFENELNKYINSLVTEDDDEIEKDNRNIFEKAIDFYIDNKTITIPITIIIVLFVGYKVVVALIRRKNRVKLGI